MIVKRKGTKTLQHAEMPGNNGQCLSVEENQMDDYHLPVNMSEGCRSD